LKTKLFLITPPFTQLNTLIRQRHTLRVLNTKGIEAFQADLGIEVILKLFSKDGQEVCLKLPV
jgi:hypothetical protein